MFVATEVSDPSYTGLIITSVTTLVALVIKGIFDYVQKRAEAREREKMSVKLDHVAKAAVTSAEGVDAVAADLARTKIEKAAKTAVLDRKLDNIGKTAEQVKGLVNGRMRVQLETNVVLARKLAQATGSPEDAALLELAEKALADHLAKEAEFA